MTRVVTADARTRTSVRAAVVVAALAMVAAMLALPAPEASSSSATFTTSPVVVDEGLVPALADVDRVTALVRVAPGAERLVAEALAASGGEVVSTLSVIETVVVEIDAAGLEALRALDGAVLSVTLDRPATLHHTVTSEEAEDYIDGFYPGTIGADALYAAGYDGDGVGVAMIDTGVTEVPDLMDRVTHAADFSGEGDGFDRFGHGTFTAGIIAGDGATSGAYYHGVAPQAEIISLKIAGVDGVTDVSRVLAAIQYAVIHKDTLGIDVLHLPIGTDSTQSWRSDPLNFAVQQAWAAGIVVVVSAGNLGPDARTIVKPGDDPWVITVGASRSMGTLERGDDTIPHFSSRGPTVDGLSKPDIVAPGAHLVGLRMKDSTADQLAPEARVDDYYFRGSGTSFAAGVVSGAVALLRQAHPDWTPDQIKGALLASAAPGPVGDPNIDGHGALDVAAAFALDDPPVANQGLGKGTGMGDIARSRGTSRSAVRNANGNAAFLDGNTNLTGQGRAFDPGRFAGASWQGASWQNSQWAGASWQRSDWKGASWQGASWQGASWQDFEWNGASWQGASWQGASWQGASWQGASWQGASWQGASWQGASWQGASWQGASWQGTAWQGLSWE